MENNIELSAIDGNQTILEFLLSLGVSRNRLKNSLPKGYLFKRVMPQDRITIPIDLLNFGLINPRYSGPKVTTIANERDFLVLNKPSGIHSQPHAYSESDNILSFLREEGLGNLQVNVQNYDRGLLYRLDQETSGLMVYLNNDDLLRRARSLHTESDHYKGYEAVVSGRVETSGIISHYIRPYGPKGSKMVEDPKELATSHLAQMELIESRYCQTTDKSFVRLRLMTGHRHQLRVQLSIMGNPILGDKLYGGDSSDRLYLHCSEFSSPLIGRFFLPSSFSSILKEN